MKGVFKSVSSAARLVGNIIMIVLALIVRLLLDGIVRGPILYIARIKCAIRRMDPWYGYEPDSKLFIRFAGVFMSVDKYMAYAKGDEIDDRMQKLGYKDALEEEYED